MSRFKAGDKVVAIGIENTDRILITNDIMINLVENRTVLCVDSYDYVDRTYCLVYYIDKSDKFWFHENDLKHYGYPINDLNKLLYPDYIEKYGLLVPKENL